MEQQQTQREYNQLIEVLSFCLNDNSKKRTKENKTLMFKTAIADLKNFYKIEVTTKFLRGLVLNHSKKTNSKIKMMLNRAGFKTEVIYKYYDITDFITYRTDIIEYGYKEFSGKPKPLIKAIIKNIRVQDIGKEFKRHKKTALYKLTA